MSPPCHTMTRPPLAWMIWPVRKPDSADDPSVGRAACEPEACELDRLRPPDVALAEHELDQPLEHPHARRSADDLGVTEPVVEAALGVHPLELLGPDLPDVLLAPDAVPDRRDRAEHEEGGV